MFQTASSSCSSDFCSASLAGEGGREGGREREGGKEGGKEGGREGGREREREGGKSQLVCIQGCYKKPHISGISAVLCFRVVWLVRRLCFPVDNNCHDCVLNFTLMALYRIRY